MRYNCLVFAGILTLSYGVKLDSDTQDQLVDMLDQVESDMVRTQQYFINNLLETQTQLINMQQDFMKVMHGTQGRLKQIRSVVQTLNSGDPDQNQEQEHEQHTEQIEQEQEQHTEQIEQEQEPEVSNNIAADPVNEEQEHEIAPAEPEQQ